MWSDLEIRKPIWEVLSVRVGWVLRKNMTSNNKFKTIWAWVSLDNDSSQISQFCLSDMVSYSGSRQYVLYYFFTKQTKPKEC